MLKTTPLIKGIITGSLMLLTTLIMGLMKIPASSGVQYLIYIFYGAGIGWTLYEYAKSPTYTGKFGAMFSTGFRCFVVVTLIMVIFTFLYIQFNPAFGDEMANLYREALTNSKDVLPNTIDDEVKKFRESFTTRMVSMSIFQFLVLGAIFTAGWSALILIRKKMQETNQNVRIS